MSSLSSPSVAEILRSHVARELEGLDRIYLNVDVPKLQYPSGVATFLRYHRGAQYASSVLLQPISDAFIAKMDAFPTARQFRPVCRSGVRSGPRPEARPAQAVRTLCRHPTA